MRRVLVAIVALGLVGCTGSSSPATTSTSDVTEAAYDVSQIRETGTQSIQLGGVVYTVTSYENEAYSCGLDDGAYPFVVVEQESDQSRPLWVMLHGGGAGWYADDGTYVGDESYNSPENPTSLLAMVGSYLVGDTAVGERLSAGDRVALGSLCDHDLYLGLGQPYPNNPAGGTVDGLLATLAMAHFVEHDRPTSAVLALGQSAGSYGAWAFAHERWMRGQAIDGAVLDSGLLSERSFELFHAGVALQYYDFDEQQMAAKHGPYFTDARLYAENAVTGGFDVPLFAADAQADPGCGGDSPPIADAANCEFLYQPLADAVRGPLQQVHLYPGAGHIVTADPGQVQDDLRQWLAALALG